VAYDEDLADRIRELIAVEGDVTEQRMFGGLAFLIGGHMAVAASGRGALMVRVRPRRIGRPGRHDRRPTEVARLLGAISAISASRHVVRRIPSGNAPRTFAATGAAMIAGWR
jgi:hypothetical protein